MIYRDICRRRVLPMLSSRLRLPTGISKQRNRHVATKYAGTQARWHHTGDHEVLQLDETKDA